MSSLLEMAQKWSGSKQKRDYFLDKAAALLQSLLKNHPFVDGNKKTALTSAGLFLKKNGYKLINSHKQEVEFTVRVDNGNLTVEQISKWLKIHSVKMSSK